MVLSPIEPVAPRDGHDAHADAAACYYGKGTALISHQNLRPRPTPSTATAKTPKIAGQHDRGDESVEAISSPPMAGIM